MKEIPLTQGKVALVDDEDYERVAVYKWQAHFSKGNWYALRRVRLGGGMRDNIYLHRFIMGNVGDLIDHKNGDGLNCTRANMRPATYSQNQANYPIPKNNSTGYKGVSYRKLYRKWAAKIKHHGKQIHLGTFSSKLEAARAYDAAAVKLKGEYAYLNFPGQGVGREVGR